jgi:hypothetical protein
VPFAESPWGMAGPAAGMSPVATGGLTWVPFAAELLADALGEVRL